MTWPILLALDPSMTAFGWAAIALTPEGPVLLAAGVIETKPTPTKRRKVEGISLARDGERRVRFIRRELVRILSSHRPALIAIEEKVGSGAGGKGVKAAESNAAAQALTTCVVDEYLGEGRPIFVTVAEARAALGIGPTQRSTKPKPSTEDKAARKAVAARKKYLGSKRMSELTADEQAEKRALAHAGAEKRDQRKEAIARAVVERLGARAWSLALGEGNVLAERWEGAHDASAVGLAAWERPEVAAVRAMAARRAAQQAEHARLMRAHELGGDDGRGAPPAQIGGHAE